MQIFILHTVYTYTHTVSPEGSVAVDPVGQVARVEETINFTCSSLGGPEVTYQWSKDGLGASLPQNRNQYALIQRVFHSSE